MISINEYLLGPLAFKDRVHIYVKINDYIYNIGLAKKR